MQRDIRDTALYREVEALCNTVRQPGSGQISDCAEVQVSPDGRFAVFAGTIMDALRGSPTTRICHIDLTSGDTRVLTFGPSMDHLPKYSPEGCQIAFLSDRRRKGNFQLHLLDMETGAARPTPVVEGWVEYLHWAPDGRRILLGVAGHGADNASGRGAITSEQVAEELPSWVPTVATGAEKFRWRHAYVYDLATDRTRQVSQESVNVWEANWCGDAAIVGIVSSGPGEGLWYSARLHMIDIDAGDSRDMYVPQDQLGCPSGSPSGAYLALVEAICSDRGLVAGQLRVIETASGNIYSVDTRGIDVTFTEWRSEQFLLVAGHRGFETVVGLWDQVTRSFTEVWQSCELSTGGGYVTVSGLGDAGDCVLAGESFTRAPEIAVIRHGQYQRIRSFDLGYANEAKAIKAAERIGWRARDGLQIEGWLLCPRGNTPHPLVMLVHGGPVWHWRPMWLGRKAALMLMLLKQGYAVFLPNARGSSGRGREFVRHVLGDMGGADTYDFLAGIDHLVEQGIADPKRIGVSGISYGGFMSAWLVAHDLRFAAAVPVAPCTNQISQHLLSNIPQFVTTFLGDIYTNPSGRYFERSPVMYAHAVKTPTLSICGALDRCTPPEEATQFHNAILANGVRSALVIYPEEGHGISEFPAAIDYVTRVVAWFQEHMPTTCT